MGEKPSLQRHCQGYIDWKEVKEDHTATEGDWRCAKEHSHCHKILCTTKSGGAQSDSLAGSPAMLME